MPDLYHIIFSSITYVRQISCGFRCVKSRMKVKSTSGVYGRGGTSNNKYSSCRLRYQTWNGSDLLHNPPPSYGIWEKWPSHHAFCQDIISRCTRGESGSILVGGSPRWLCSPGQVSIKVHNRVISVTPQKDFKKFCTVKQFWWTVTDLYNFVLQAENIQKGSQKDRKGDLHYLLNWIRILLNVISGVSGLGIYDCFWVMATL